MKQIILSGETITRPLLQEEEAEADESGQQQKHSHPRFHLSVISSCLKLKG
jgi:hypothetical protein